MAARPRPGRQGCCGQLRRAINCKVLNLLDVKMFSSAGCSLVQSSNGCYGEVVGFKLDDLITVLGVIKGQVTRGGGTNLDAPTWERRTEELLQHVLVAHVAAALS